MNNEAIREKALRLASSITAYESLSEWLQTTEQFTSEGLIDGQFNQRRSQQIVHFLSMFKTAFTERVFKDIDLVGELLDLCDE
jgi:hypothetical protein